MLNLTGNALSDWADVEHLVRLCVARGACKLCSRHELHAAAQAHQPALEQLHLSANRLTRIQPPSHADAFAKLHALLLASNRIDDWCDRARRQLARVQVARA